MAGRLVDLVVRGESVKNFMERAFSLPAIQLSPRSMCDLELLATGGFSPLRPLHGQADYDACFEEMRLANGMFSDPHHVAGEQTDDVIGQDIALRGPNNELLAVMTVEEHLAGISRPKPARFSARRTGVTRWWPKWLPWGDYYISGPAQVLNLPQHFDFAELRRTPAKRGRCWRIRSLECGRLSDSNPLHRAHEELTKRAAAEVGWRFLLHPVVGVTKPGDVDHYTRVTSIQGSDRNYYDPSNTY